MYDMEIGVFSYFYLYLVDTSYVAKKFIHKESYRLMCRFVLVSIKS